MGFLSRLGALGGSGPRVEVPAVALHVTDHRSGFGPGLTEIVPVDDDEGTGIGVAVLRLAAGERRTIVAERETAWLLMDGALEVELGPRRARWSRASLFEEGPSCAHLAAGTEIALAAVGDAELMRFSTASTRRFGATLRSPRDVEDEHRGAGHVRDACHRIVRTIFDATSTDPAAELVLGEVLTLPGRWSSYPPHHHAQPEIYHYRFTHPSGYGHAELGEEVVKVRAHDTVKIVPSRDHAQVAAPGYGMYYAWVIRHLPGAPYTSPTFAEEHIWVMDPGAPTWWPAGGE